jgi:hypothetical protein
MMFELRLEGAAQLTTMDVRGTLVAALSAAEARRAAGDDVSSAIAAALGLRGAAALDSDAKRRRVECCE